jgi:hypothetical protein
LRQTDYTKRLAVFYTGTFLNGILGRKEKINTGREGHKKKMVHLHGYKLEELCQLIQRRENDITYESF